MGCVDQHGSEQPADTSTNIAGAQVESAGGDVLTAKRVNAVNTFATSSFTAMILQNGWQHNSPINSGRRLIDEG
jgi:hypothetical protein